MIRNACTHQKLKDMKQVARNILNKNIHFNSTLLLLNIPFNFNFFTYAFMQVSMKVVHERSFIILIKVRPIDDIITLTTNQNR